VLFLHLPTIGFQTIVWDQIIQNAMLKNPKDLIPESGKSLPGTPVQATIQ
jgi:hypothetical protein